jgi:hypothetical protein
MGTILNRTIGSTWRSPIATLFWLVPARERWSSLTKSGLFEGAVRVRGLFKSQYRNQTTDTDQSEAGLAR